MPLEKSQPSALFKLMPHSNYTESNKATSETKAFKYVKRWHENGRMSNPLSELIGVLSILPPQTWPHGVRELVLQTGWWKAEAMVISIVCDSTLLKPGSFLKHLNIHYHENILHVDLKYQISSGDLRQAASTCQPWRSAAWLTRCWVSLSPLSITYLQRE